MAARITLSYGKEEYAEAVVKAVTPDNLIAPPGLSIKTVRRKAKVVTQITGVKSIKTLLATIDDLLMAVQIAEKTLSAHIFNTKPKKEQS